MATVPSQSTFAIGDKISADSWNDDVRDALNFLLNPPRCSVYLSVTSTFTTAVWKLVSFGGEDYDTDSMHDTGTNPSRVTFPTLGKYLIISQIAFDAAATGVRAFNLRANSGGSQVGGINIGAWYFAASTSPGTYQSTFEFIPAAGDYLELFGFQSSGGNLNCSAGTGGTFLKAFFWTIS